MTSVKLHDNPVQDVTIQTFFHAPSGKTETVDGFWDGDRTWRVRFCPNEIGAWQYETQCENDSGLGGQKGEFGCAPYEGNNPLYTHGDIHLSEGRYYLVHADGTPFFWLGDTGWNGALFSDKQSWDAYLSDRRNKGFTGIQFMATQHRAAPSDSEGRVPFSGIKRITVNPLYFQRLDQRIDAVNEAGMVPAPVLLWVLGDSPGNYLPEYQRIVLARYMVARYGVHQIIWILGGDGNYQGQRAEPWQRIGRAVFGDNPRRLATMHPQGRHWIADEFRHESWFGFNCYQSGHGFDEHDLRWLCEGPPAKDWNKEPRHPNLNFEPNYEGHLPYGASKPFDAHAVRRAAYWSLLVAPPAGVTYGAHYNRGKTKADIPSGFKLIQGDRKDYSVFEAQMAHLEPFDTVTDMIGFVPEEVESDVRSFRGRTKQFIFCSTIDVYTKPAKRYPIREDEERQPVESFPYAYDKAKCERILEQAHKRGDFPVTIIRPAHTYGEGRGLIDSFRGGAYYLDRIRQGKPIIVHGDGNSLWASCYRDDVARAFVAAIGNEKTY